MTATDARGEAVSGATGPALDLYEKALGQFQVYQNDPVESIDAAIAANPDFAMAHALRGYLYGLAFEAGAQPEVKAAVSALDKLPLNERERRHQGALSAFAAAEWDVAADRLDDIIVAYPRDALAVQAVHLLDFYRGDARSLRDRIARVLPMWDADTPGYHALLGMHSFGLEECNQFDLAEAAGRQAVELNRNDAWAIHAVAHVLEMRGEAEAGAEWLRSRADDWSVENFFSVHNWWHLALFELDHDKIDAALGLYDGQIQADGSEVVLDMVDASALLWRLHLRRVDVGDRWRELADRWVPSVADGFYSFNDFHAMMAFVGDDRQESMDATLATLTKRAEDNDYNGRATREVGLPLARAIAAFGRGDYGTTVDILRPIRSIANRFGGSNAQRDVLDLTLLEAATRDGQRALVRSLAAARTALKPDSPIGWHYQRQAGSTPEKAA